MKSTRTGKAVPPRRALTQHTGAGETGALHIEGDPGGIVYLTDGWVSYVESPGAPGVGELLTTSGRLPTQVWAAAAASGEPVGPLLVAQGHLTQGELELCTLGALYDAAFFALSPTPARVRFEPGVRHSLGPVCQVDAAVLGRELTRRRKLLDDVHPISDVDTGRLRTVPRAPTPRLVVTAPQWELIVHCDGERTAADLARLLGRAGYATVLELRRLAAAGLVTAIAPDVPAADEATAEPSTVVTATALASGAAKGDGRSAEQAPAKVIGRAPAARIPGRTPVTRPEVKTTTEAAEKSGAAKGDDGPPDDAAKNDGHAGREAARAKAAEKGAAARRTTAARRAVAASPGAAGRPQQTEARLPRRADGEPGSGPDPPAAFTDELDEALLNRIRSGLEAL
ncbi:ADAM 12 protein [Phytohabitans kaempferiae]|uniref:ADAM 12 protein n=1 Tax=Phytohabitans kaempferiae TaxID=1620943 RepID=A0ABV6MCY1_9ACTN